MTTDPDQLVTLTTATSEFTAHLTIAVLADAGIEAFSFGSTSTTFGLTGEAMQARWGVPVQVRRSDLDRARNALTANKRDSIDIDWDMVNVGDRIEHEHAPGHAAVLAGVGWIVATALVLLGLLAAVAVLIGG